MASATEGFVFGLIFTLIYTIFFKYIGVFIGRSLVWIVSFGRYPKQNPSPTQRVVVLLVGVLALVAALMVIRNSF